MQGMGVAAAVVSLLAAVSAPAPSHADDTLGDGPCHADHPHVVPPGCVPSTAGTLREAVASHVTLPNLRPLPPEYVVAAPEYVPSSYVGPVPLTLAPTDTYHLRFDTIAANVGDHTLELAGVPTSDPFTWGAYQCTSWEATRACRERRPVGTMAWHPEHNHVHFDDFAVYELRSLTAEGTPDHSATGLVASSPKVSFCLQDSTAVDDSGRPPFYAGCAGALQGISPGWADVYGSGLPGQSMPLAGIPDGRYALVFTLDPDNHLFEDDEDDNTAWSMVEISGDGTSAQVMNG